MPETDPVVTSVSPGTGSPSRYTSTSGATVVTRRSGAAKKSPPADVGRLGHDRRRQQRHGGHVRHHQTTTSGGHRAPSYIPMGCQTVLISRNAAIHSGRWARASSSQSKPSTPDPGRPRDPLHVLDRGLLQSDPQRSRHAEGIDAVDVLWPASQGTSSARWPEMMLMTPPGTSLVARISDRVMAGNGLLSEVSTTAVLPPTTTGASRDTSPSSDEDSGATMPTTPVGSGMLKSK